MLSFLQQVAGHYAAAANLEDYCFVFPNRRSGKFFEQRLAEAARGRMMMPRIMAMADFLGDVTSYNQVGQLEATLVLYKAYRQVMGDSAAPMDTFVFWANLIINDFNDADMNLVDVEQLYKNLHDLREIATDYLDPDLKRDIERVLGINLPPDADSERLWKDWQGHDDDGEVRRQYFSLWQKLYDIYLTFHQLLEQQGLHTVGRIYRDAVSRIKLMPDDRLPLRVVMVGFSSLSVSEMAVFKALKQRGVADFWWDMALDVLRNDRDNPAGSMVRVYADMFAMPQQLEPVQLAGKHVEAVAVPSVVGQAKWAFDRIDQMIEHGDIAHPDNAINTAIVLPDESLFVPLINSVSDRVGQLNVTMGYPLRQSNIVSLMHLVARAHKQASRRDNEWTYYREDVKDILSHPIIKAVFTRQALAITDRITAQNLWNVPANELCQMGFGTLFQPMQDVTDSNQVIAYIDRLTEFCRQVNERIKQEDMVKDPREEHDDDDTKKHLPLQSAFIELYVDALEQIKLSFAVHGVPVADDTLFFLIDRLTQTAVVPFEGEPLKGLQVMGLQETRSLDFDNIIILSMNERVFPRRHGIASLIPDNLRAAFYMLTSSRQETIAAYDFYRLIGRARNVVLVYASAAAGGGGSEPSRFISQLKLLYGIRKKEKEKEEKKEVEKEQEQEKEVEQEKVDYTDYQVDTRVTSPTQPPITVDKVSPPMHDYVQPSAQDRPEEAHSLSHSSISEFIECPLKFYFHHVEHLSDDDDTSDFMDYGTFGTIIHDTLQELYYPRIDAEKERTGDYRVTADDIESFKEKKLKDAVRRNINRSYLHHSDNAALESEGLILEEAIKTYVQRALDFDLKLIKKSHDRQLVVLECEKEHKVQLDLGGVRFNFTYKPDRVDRIDGCLRMVDYKTGSDPTSFTTLDDLFVTPPPSSSSKRCKAIAQLMLYCNAWQLEHNEDRLIEPMIYKLKAIDETGVFRVEDKVKKSLVFDAGDDFNAQFSQRMGGVIGRLLDMSEPFTQAEPGSKCCGHCRFADFCHR